jgi:hypothetical protein
MNTAGLEHDFQKSDRTVFIQFLSKSLGTFTDLHHFVCSFEEDTPYYEKNLKFWFFEKNPQKPQS